MTLGTIFLQFTSSATGCGLQIRPRPAHLSSPKMLQAARLTVKISEEIEQILKPPGIKHGLLENPEFIYYIYIYMYMCINIYIYMIIWDVHGCSLWNLHKKGSSQLAMFDYPGECWGFLQVIRPTQFGTEVFWLAWLMTLRKRPRIMMWI